MIGRDSAPVTKSLTRSALDRLLGQINRGVHRVHRGCSEQMIAADPKSPLMRMTTVKVTMRKVSSSKQLPKEVSVDANKRCSLRYQPRIGKETSSRCRPRKCYTNPVCWL